MDPIISHIRFDKKDGEWIIQTNKDHCKGVATMSEEFASHFGMGEWGRIIGLMHDRGKENFEFQRKIRFNSGYDTSLKVTVNATHSLAGAIVLNRKLLLVR